MDPSLTASVTQLVGDILDLRQKHVTNQDLVKSLESQIQDLTKTNKELHEQLEEKRQLLDYVLATGEDPVAAALTLNKKEIARKARRQKKSRESDTFDVLDDHWGNPYPNDRLLDAIRGLRSINEGYK